MSVGPDGRAIEWLYALRGPSLKWDIATAQAFAAHLGHPQRDFRSIHLAGTNGKGSVAAMVHAIASASGLRCGLFTSPHLVSPTERIRIGEQDIAAEELDLLIEELRRAAGEALEQGALPRHPSFFEMMTAAAFLAFSRARVDLAVFETGLGGRLDATNVIFPLVSVITTIGLDHTKTLGPTLTKIATEKGGIVKPGVPVLVGWMDDAPERTLRDIAHRRGAPCHLARREVGVYDVARGRFDVVTPTRRYRSLDCRLDGSHQRRNAAIAVRAIELLRERGVPIAAGAAETGLPAVRWPGRLERVESHPPHLLDAAHNAEGIEALTEHLRALADRGDAPEGPTVLVFGLTDGRDPVELLGPLLPLVDGVVVTRAVTPRAQDPREIGRKLEEAGRPVTTIDDHERALERAAAMAGEAGLVLVCGSLYLVGDVRRTLFGLEGPGHPAQELADLGAADDAASP